jgi:hypothetical protein
MGLICERLLLHTPDCMRLLVAAPRVLGSRLLLPVVLARGRTDLAIPLEPGDDLWLCGGLFTAVERCMRWYAVRRRMRSRKGARSLDPLTSSSARGSRGG